MRAMWPCDEHPKRFRLPLPQMSTAPELPQFRHPDRRNARKIQPHRPIAHSEWRLIDWRWTGSLLDERSEKEERRVGHPRWVGVLSNITTLGIAEFTRLPMNESGNSPPSLLARRIRVS